MEEETRVKTYICLHCGVECKHGPSKINKFCSNRCQRDFQWINETKPAIVRGEKTHYAVECLKRYLKEEVGDCCAICGLGPVWNNAPLVLQLDHKDGNSDNNHPDNLRLICPNCHTQTPTFGSKGFGNRYRQATNRSSYIRKYRGRLAQR